MALFQFAPVILFVPLPWDPAFAFVIAWSLAQAARQFGRAWRHRRLARETARQAGTLQQQGDAAAATPATLQAAAA